MYDNTYLEIEYQLKDLLSIINNKETIIEDEDLELAVAYGFEEEKQQSEEEWLSEIDEDMEDDCLAILYGEQEHNVPSTRFIDTNRVYCPFSFYFY